MEFNEKLQELRKNKGLTQEELANALFVSRTAVSKWESGRGYPSIDSLREISRFFSVTIDELICPDEIISAAENEKKEFISRNTSLVFGLLDVFMAVLLLMPVFGNGAGSFFPYLHGGSWKVKRKTYRENELTVKVRSSEPKTERRFTQAQLQQEYNYLQAERITKRLLDKGLITLTEYGKIMMENRKSFPTLLAPLLPEY